MCILTVVGKCCNNKGINNFDIHRILIRFADKQDNNKFSEMSSNFDQIRLFTVLLCVENSRILPFFLLNVFTVLKGTHFYIVFVVTTTGVVLCDGPKKLPRSSFIVQFIFYVCSFEISGNILRHQNIS